MIRTLALCLFLATPAVAQTEPTEPEPEECQSCTARHKALQKLQDARQTPPPETPPAREGTEDVADE